MSILKRPLSRMVLVAAMLTLPAIAFAQQQTDLTQYVEPRIGTAHSRWFFFTPGAVPFGMAKPAPSTNGSYGNAHGWDAVGYDYRHTSIEGFANFHEFQVGGVVFAPTVGSLQTVPGKTDHPENGYRSAFTHDDERATAGYYSVQLKKYGIKAELTATPRVAFHRYTFPSSNEAHILFDIGNKQGEGGEVKDAKVYMTPDGRIEGYVITRPVYVLKYQPGAEVAMYFSAQLDKKPTSVGTFVKEKVNPGDKEVSGKGAGIYLNFNTVQNETITIKAGLSYTSIENARLNLQTEAAGMTFDQAKAKAHTEWNNYLHRIEVSGSTHENKVKFYTGLYHALLGRGLASDVNGAYPRNDGSVGQIPLDKNGKPQHNHYNTDAIWGGFWNLTQLWAMAYPEYYSDYIKSQLLIYKDSGWLADGIANSRYVSGVGTNFVSLIIASAYMCGIRDFDIKTGYAAALKNEIDGENRPHGAGKSDVAQFVKNGYVPHLDKGNGGGELWQFSASHTLEYAYSSYAVGQWAKALGKTDDYNLLNRLSKGWENIYDPSLKLVRPKLASGQFIDNFKPSEVWRGFQEGNALQYTFYVPQDPQGLIAKVGRDEFNKRLDSVFTFSQKNAFGGGTTLDAFSGLEAPYNHGNQPNLHISWMFNYSGKPSLTQKWVRAICNVFYGADGIHGYGYGQDEDQGQLGAWYVISSMGLFDVKGLTDTKPSFGIGSPLFDKVTIKLNSKYYKGKTFTIETKGNSDKNMYVRSITVNGKAVHTPFISFADVVNGGKLSLQMGAVAKDKY
ncbi:glycoside hydrolase family 92 protein [Mucilaginibacter mali]|uniref:Glycoside hydrolase family 92 protein n=2 Tax=Mucilaginibacter mali TaxID=2740462 RepID=A0A7D4QDK3_9SPHI|nr:glycoside hydrolase family 92 protein [Mucilaginibacter mali]